MGWFDDKYNDKEVLISDEMIETAHAVLVRIAREYKRDSGRKPTPEEIARTFEIAICIAEDKIFDGMRNKALDKLIIEFKDTPPKQMYYKGDYFAVPLPSGGYGFVQITEVFSYKNILINILDMRSDHVVSIEELSGVKVLKDMLTEATDIENWVWKKVDDSQPEDSKGRKKKQTYSKDFMIHLRRLMEDTTSNLVYKHIEEVLNRKQ
ncbi:MAG: hypothetical protein ACYC27_14045 [Armatimonadota bacterium]